MNKASPTVSLCDGDTSDFDCWQDGSTQWESADLGSDERKQKFLRLMGAAKVSARRAGVS